MLFRSKSKEFDPECYLKASDIDLAFDTLEELIEHLSSEIARRLLNFRSRLNGKREVGQSISDVVAELVGEIVKTYGIFPDELVDEALLSWLNEFPPQHREASNVQGAYNSYVRNYKEKVSNDFGFFGARYHLANNGIAEF